MTQSDYRKGFEDARQQFKDMEAFNEKVDSQINRLNVKIDRTQYMFLGLSVLVIVLNPASASFLSKAVLSFIGI